MGITLFLFIQAAVALWGIRWVIQVRSKCFPEYKSSWLAQLAGLSLVVIGTLGIGGLNLTQGSIAGSILFLTVYVAGIFLFLAGLSRWLAPVLEAAREQHYTLRRLVFLKNLRQKLNNEKSLQQISQTALAEFLETLPFRAGALYLRESLSSEMSLTASLGVRELSLPSILEREEWRSFSGPRQSEPLNARSNGNTWAGSFPLPLRVGGQMVGIAFFWPEQRQTILPDSKLIELWGNALSDRIFDWRKNELKKLRQKTLKIMGQVESLLAAHDSLDLLFPKLGGLLKPLLDYQVCALVTVDRACQNLERYTLGPAGNLLWEKGVSCPAGKSLVEKVCRSGKILIENGADRPSTSKENTLPLLAACRSVLAVPLKSGQRVWGVVLFGHRELNQYRKIEGKLLGLILHQLTFHLRLRELQDEVSKRDRLLHILEQLDSQISKTSDQSDRLKNISEVLSRALPVTACRISILSRGGASLEPLSEFSLREKEKFVFSSEPISLEKLPWHRLALLSKKAMLVNQSDPESMMPQEEIRTAFSRPINSALLIPLVWGEKTVGLLSLAEEREWNRRPLTYPEILTAELAADRLVNLLNISPREGTPKQSQEEIQRLWQASSAQLRRQLSDPLCGILGASELILTKGEGLDSDSQRYARIIHRMAERIKDWVTHESETPLAS